MIERLNKSHDGIIAFHAGGKLTHQDYAECLIPEVESALDDCGKISLFFEMEDFHGWEMQAAWDDLKLGLKINRNLERIALVGDSRWEKWLAGAAGLFADGEVRYYDHEHRDDAWEWLESA